MINIEETLLNKRDSLLNKFLKFYPEINLWESNGVSHWHFVYLNNNPELCIYMAGYSENAVPRDLRFKEAYQSLMNTNYSDLLLLLTYYGHIETNELISKINGSKKPVSELVRILLGNISNGYLAFAHQFETLYSTLSGSTAIESNKFRTDWNKKIPQTRIKANQLFFSKELSFTECIKKYAFYEEGPFFLNANFHKAKLLYDYIT